MGVLNAALSVVARAAFRVLPTAGYAPLLRSIIAARAERLPADDALRMLFALERGVYELESRQSIRLGDGLHLKHALTNYHAFFVAHLHSGERVLDVGCGNGALAWDMAEKASVQVVGIDLSQQFIDTANSKHAHPNVTYHCGDATRDLPDEAFDVVVLSNVLEHIADRTALLNAIKHSAHPKRLLIRVPLYERDWRVPLMQQLGCDWRLDPDHETEYTQDSFTEEMTRAGLAIDHRETHWGEIWAEVRPI